MPKIKHPAPIGPPGTGGAWDGKKKVRKLSKSPCNRPPVPPDAVRVKFHVREAKTHLEYDTVVNWGEVAEDIHGFETRIARYYVQLRPCNQWGNPINWTDDPEGWNEWRGEAEKPKNAKPIVRKRTVDKPKDQDPDDFAHVSFGETVRPKKWYYHARVRAEDTEGCKSEWTEWCDPANALQVGATRPLPPTPSGVRMEFDVIDRGRWDRYSAEVTMNEVGHWDIPDGDDEDDVAFYSCQLQGGQSQTGPWDGKIRTHTRSARDGDNDSTVTFNFASKIKKHRWYRARARTVDRFNRRGAWSNWTAAGSPSDNNPPPNPRQVEAYGRHNHIGIDWSDPEHPQDPELAHPDIAYAQVQLATSASGFGASTLRFDKMVMGSRKEWESVDYKRRYWLRVRYIDGSDNKGNWVQAGPVRPQKTGGTRVVASGVTTRDAATTLPGAIVGVGNRAYRSGSGVSIAVLEGETNTGTMKMRLQAARSSAMAAGAVLRYTNTSNYLILRLANSLELVTRVGGSEVTRISGITVEPSGVYDVECVISTGGQVTVSLDGVARGSYLLSESERAALSGTRHGVYFGSADSNSRIEWIQWTPSGATVPSFEDEFVRAASSASLGTADSGDAWETISGQVGVSPDSVPDAVFADLWANGDSNKLGEILIPNSGHIKLGENGLNSGAISVEIDRPTRFVAMGNTAIENSGANEFTAHLFLVCVDTSTGVEYLGKAGRTFCAVNDYIDSRPRHVSTIHDVFINCPEGSSRIVNWWWGYRCGGTNTRRAYIGPQVMFVQWREAHDVVDGPGLTRPAGLRKAKAIDRYRRSQNNE